MKKLFLLFCLLFFLTPLFAQKKLPQIKILTTETKTSIRGLCVVNDQVIWVSGSNGTVGKSADGGKSWQWQVVKGFEEREFRDIEAFDATTAVIIAIGAPAYILKTNDGGATWKTVYENAKAGMFLDAMDFWQNLSGIVVGDPIDGKFFVARTFDGGSTWKEIPEQDKPVADSGEACFAASGTNVRLLSRDEAVFVSGGKKSRMFIRNTPINLPIIQGKETTGANSIAVSDQNSRKRGTTMMVVGGDFKNDKSTVDNCFYTTNQGKTWHAPVRAPHGYRSSVEYISKKRLVACGTSGVDYSTDGGKNWSLISDEGFHVARIAKNGSAVFLAGSNGKIGKLIYGDK